ncbi:MAG: transketolase family protein [Chloroflexota bacterium]
MADKIATRQAYGDTLVELGRDNPDIVVLDADLSKSTMTAGFAKAYPDRFFNAGIAEQDLMGMAAGLSTMGKIPFASTFAVFAAGRAFEQVRNTICYPKLNVKIAATHAGITVGEDGGSHQSVEDIALMRVLPNMTIIAPADAVEASQAVRAAAAHRGPVYIRLSRLATPVIFDARHEFEIGKAVVVREGKDISLFSTGTMLAAALAAADRLADEGLRAEVVNVATIKPLDAGTILASLAKTGCGVTCEEHSIIGGLGSAIAEIVVENDPLPLTRVGLLDVFGESGKPDELLQRYGLTGDDIVIAARRAFLRKTHQ